MWKIARTALIALVLPLTAAANEVEILYVKSVQRSNGWEVHVTLRHKDTGWDHYADKWEVRLRDGTVIGTRVLLHPHVKEQPFTRSLSGVSPPNGELQVEIHAHDSEHGWAEEVYAHTLGDN